MSDERSGHETESEPLQLEKPRYPPLLSGGGRVLVMGVDQLGKEMLIDMARLEHVDGNHVASSSCA